MTARPNHHQRDRMYPISPSPLPRLRSSTPPARLDSSDARRHDANAGGAYPQRSTAPGNRTFRRIAAVALVLLTNVAVASNATAQHAADLDRRRPTAAAPARVVRAAAANRLDHARYAKLLTTYTRVSDSLAVVEVDYAGLARSKDLDLLVEQIAASRPSKMGHVVELAFWINTYNILTLDLVRKHPGIESIKKIGSLFSPVWKQPLVTIEGEPTSLDRIEHAILRPMRDPRIHGAIVCASKSCPPLFRRPFRAERLGTDLDAAMRIWLASRRKGVAIDRAARRLTVSKVFYWFEEDFAEKGGVKAFIAPYLAPADKDWLRGPGHDATLDYFEYDWSLNGRPAH